MDDARGSPPLRAFACQRCSRRKQKCDRAIPVCSQCKSAGSDCRRSEKEDTVVHLTDNEIARKGYITTIEDKIAFLESQLASRRQDTDNATRNETNSGFHTLTPRGDDGPLQESHPRSQPGDTNVNMGPLSLQAMAEPRDRSGEFLKELSVPRIIASVTETYGGNPETSSRPDTLWDGIAKYIRHPSGQRGRLHISHVEASGYLQAYMETVDFRFPRLSIEKVQKGIAAITDPEDSKYGTMLKGNPAYIFMAYIVIAIVSLVSANHPTAHGSFVSIHIMAKCVQMLDQVFNQEDGVDIIQCLHLLVVFSLHSSAAGSSWHLIGFAMNKCISLGYHQEQPICSFSSEELEQRRWAFWSCYLLDRMISAALDRPFSIDDQHITVLLPGQCNQLPCSLTPPEQFESHLFQYSIVLSSMVSNVKEKGFGYCLGQALHWKTSRPPQEASLEQPCSHQNSLYNTLMLRLIIQQLTCLYDCRYLDDTSRHIIYDNPDANISTFTPTDSMIEAERMRISDLRLIGICRDVAQSLNRPTMAQRHFLSMTTGYSAFSMGLAALYYLAVMERSQYKTTPSVDSRRNISLEGYGHGQLDSLFDIPIASLLPFGGDEELQSPSNVDKLLDVACQKLQVVGIQFPRMPEYCKLLRLIQCFI